VTLFKYLDKGSSEWGEDDRTITGDLGLISEEVDEYDGKNGNHIRRILITLAFIKTSFLLNVLQPVELSSSAWNIYLN
jgi:hypothetical protein